MLVDEVVGITTDKLTILTFAVGYQALRTGKYN
jgi:hypothetical protein